MAHLLVTRYTVKEDFGFQKGLKTLNDIENKVKDFPVGPGQEPFDVPPENAGRFVP